MTGLIINLFLLAFCLASFTSPCLGNFDAVISPTSSTISGHHKLVITPELRRQFGISKESDLKTGVRKHFGKSPDYAFVQSPTPWNDLYSTYHWHQVTSRMTAQLGSSFHERETTSVIASNDYTNESELNVTIKETLSHTIYDSVETTWSGEVGLAASFDFSVNVFFVKGSASLDLTTKFGYAKTETKSSTMGSGTEVELTLRPKSSVTVEIVSKIGEGVATMRYKAMLEGSVATKYNRKYKNHHYWSIAVTRVLRALGKPNTKIITQTIKSSVYFTKSIVIRDRRSRGVLRKFDVDNEDRVVINEMEDGSFCIEDNQIIGVN
ncbi:spherulin-2A [Folsomia candida]|nr:spherulin-2A [Folsomia candida]